MPPRKPGFLTGWEEKRKPPDDGLAFLRNPDD
jgi:hypothetical protein